MSATKMWTPDRLRPPSRREALLSGGTLLTTAALIGAAPIQDARRAKVLFFTKSSGFEHSVVRRNNGAPAYAERVFTEIAGRLNIEVIASKDGTIFDQDLSKFDAFVFYTTGDLTQTGTDKTPPMSAAGKARLLDAIAQGKGFVGSHCASDTFHSSGDRFATQTKRDPYIEMIGGEFIRHGRQQPAKMTIVDPRFPGFEGLGESFEMHEEWYSLKNFASDLQVLLVNETQGMSGKDYQRPRFPATWARMHHQGRVFYTSMGHREDVWASDRFQSLFLGGLQWAIGRLPYQVQPNLKEVTPGYAVMPPK